MIERDADTTAEMPKRPRRAGDGIAEGTDFARQTVAARDEPVDDEASMLLDKALCKENVLAAYKRVVRNGGSPGVDGMTVDDLMPWCREHWSRVREELLSDRYRPQPVRRVEIPKPGGKGAAPIKRCNEPGSTWPQGIDGWWIWTLRNSSTA